MQSLASVCAAMFASRFTQQNLQEINSAAKPKASLHKVEIFQSQSAMSSPIASTHNLKSLSTIIPHLTSIFTICKAHKMVEVSATKGLLV